MTPTYFYSFDQRRAGLVITSGGGTEVVYTRNPYGGHGLVLVNANSREAFRHGTLSVVGWALCHMDQRAYRRVRRFLAARGIGIKWCLTIPSNWN